MKLKTWTKLITATAIIFLTLPSCKKEPEKKGADIILSNIPEPVVNAGWRKMGRFFNHHCKVHYLFSGSGKAYLWIDAFVADNEALPDIKSSMYAYEPNTNSFSAKAPLPEESNGLGCWTMVIGSRAFYGVNEKMWEYDFNQDKWTARKDFPYKAQFPAIFTTKDRGYICGFQGENGYRSNDTLYEYNPDSDTWQGKTNLPGNRYFMFKTAFSLNNMGYVFGTTGLPTDKGVRCWEYKADSMKWLSKVYYPVDTQTHTSFTRNNKGYIYCGSNINSKAIRNNSIYEFDPIANKWTKQSDFPGPIKSIAVAFTIDNKSYIGFGYNEALTENVDNDLWEYNP